MQGTVLGCRPFCKVRRLTLGTQVNLLWANDAQVLTIVGKSSEAQKEQFNIGFEIA